MAIVTGKIRASYASVWEPRTDSKGENPKYQITLLIPKTDTTTLNKIYADMERAKQEGVAKTFGGSIPPVLSYPLHDGDGVKPNSGEPFGEECRGCMVVTASSKTPPSVVDINIQPILNRSEFKSGDYARVSINFFAYNSNGKKGIGCALNNVQKLEDGEPLAGGTTATEDFGGLNAYQPDNYQTPQPNYTQQTYQTAPPPQYTQQPAQQAYQPMQPNYAQQTYQPMPQQPAQPVYQPMPQHQYNPITGAPMTGGVMGL